MKQKGLSLVELLVAMVVTMLLLAGMLQILLGQRESFGIQRQQAALQQNARVASFLVESLIARAGYYPEALRDGERVFRAGGPIAGKDGQNGAPDEITVRFQSDGHMSDCAGGSIPAGAISINRFYLSSGGSSLLCQRRLIQEDGSPVLRADGSRIGTSTLPMIGNVQGLQVAYGADSNGDGSVDVYRHANQVADFARVRSVRVQLGLTSSGAVLLPVPGQAADRRQRLLVDRVVALRNRLP